MKPNKLQLKNTIKNIFLLVLFLAMIVLTCLTWLTDLDLDGNGADSLIARAYQRVIFSTGGFELRSSDTPAADPYCIAVTSDNGLMGAQYNEASINVLYGVLKDSMGSALALCNDFIEISEQSFEDALQGEVLYFGYESYLPVHLLASWLGSGSDHEIDLQTDFLLLTGAGEVLIHDASDRYYASRTPAKPRQWKEAIQDIAAAKCSFAVSLKGSLSSLRSDMLIFDNDYVRADDLQERLPNFQEGNAGGIINLLQAFQYDPYVSSFPEDNKQVYVETYSTLRVTNDGQVIFRASTMEGGLQVYTGSEAKPKETLQLKVDFARSLLESVQASYGDNSKATLFSIASGQDNTQTLIFIQTVNGIPIIRDKDRLFARFEFQDNLLVDAKLNLCSYEPTGKLTFVLPARQAAAAIPAGSDHLSIAYLLQDNGILKAFRCFRT